MVLCVVLAVAVLASASERPLATSCRARNVSLPELQFRLHTCALCYSYMHAYNFLPAAKWRAVTVDGSLQLRQRNLTVQANVSDEATPLLLSFVDSVAVSNWRACCHQAATCCTTMLTTQSVPEPEWCPRTWDGWLCWPDAPPHTLLKEPCPAFIHFGTTSVNCLLLAEKRCGDGRWGTHPDDASLEWTNYTTCSVVSSLERRLHISIAALGASVALLLPAIVIFHVYRQLNCVRLSLHKNLFTSLLLNAICEIWFKTYLIHFKSHTEESLIKKNSIVCKLVVLLTKYFRLSNYLWMFCEGLYLHHIITIAFKKVQKLLIFYIVGWGLPLIFVSLYALFRAVFSDSDCWAFPTPHSEWLLYVPCLLSLLVNTAFLVHIIRILMSKLRASYSHESLQYRKAVRATLVLIPLFGLHFVVTIYRPSSGICHWEEYYVYADTLLDGLQGAFVAVIFCYWNSEIRSNLQRSYKVWVERHFVGQPATQNTQHAASPTTSRNDS
ncbi:calcitonin gene-related peptide type 1 receptor-like [Bacillus rossius redtenbacheri]|uniref:calcitonin gene-related peptide type 1 receptor-like n=1 Tax=Bacillus rossius redtenbacheri TaxID=93214 RepID=UPI002FDDECCD